jgi:hypothetical protein
VIYLLHPWSNLAWADYWLWTGIYLPLLIAIGTTVWFTIGCSYDLRLFFRRLAMERIDLHDDGTVNKDDEAGGTSEDENECGTEPALAKLAGHSPSSTHRFR